MPHAAPRRRRTLLSVVAAAFIIGALPIGARAYDPAGHGEFMYALGQVESGGRYDAVNQSSGAYGKYQIMPNNWRAWARLYLGNANAKPTPQNQERVARAKIRALHRWLGKWSTVAHWWLTGSSSRDVASWSEYSTDYVRRVMAIYREVGGGKPKPSRKPARPSRHVIGDGSRSVVYRGNWQRAGHEAYSGDTVRHSSRRGSSVGLTFTGRVVTVVGPKGPTRGRARVYLDGKPVRTVDLGSPTFQARAKLFGASWARPGRHTIRIVVLGTPGRPMVAIDEFIVRR